MTRHVKNTIKTLVHFLILSVSISFIVYGTQNQSVEYYVSVGIGLMLVQVVLGLFEYAKDMASGDTTETGDALRLNSAEAQRFTALLVVSLINVLAFWGAGYALILIYIESLTTMIIVSFVGMIIGSILAGTPVVLYVLNRIRVSEQTKLSNSGLLHILY